ncbi:MAG TPA: hypothetical protein VFA07_10215 [Chthonomonadaceae bacterium]|nr:hypothetical protein [Chthonomonadaceae bacterium]
MSQEGLSTAAIQAIFLAETEAAQGKVKDTFEDGSRLYIRSILPEIREVRKKDPVQAGVALRATAQDVWIHPYIFRQVCKNGAIMAHALQTRHIARLDLLPPEEATTSLREAIRSCSCEEAFTEAVEGMRTATERAVDFAIQSLALLARIEPAALRGQIMGDILSRYFEAGDHSQFGLMNAITASARDTSDPETRWQLETSGGGVLACLRHNPVRDDRAAEVLPVLEERFTDLLDRDKEAEAFPSDLAMARR